MLKIQVLGQGMIPRGFGLAPRKEFFNADLNTIQTILMTPSLKVNMQTPDGKIVPIRRDNVKKLWDKYNNVSRSTVLTGVAMNNKTPETPQTLVETSKVPSDITTKPDEPKVTDPVKPIAPVETPKAPVVEQKDTQAVNITQNDAPKPVETNKQQPNPNPVKPVTNENAEKADIPKNTSGGLKPVLNPNDTDKKDEEKK